MSTYEFKDRFEYLDDVLADYPSDYLFYEVVTYDGDDEAEFSFYFRDFESCLERCFGFPVDRVDTEIVSFHGETGLRVHAFVSQEFEKGFFESFLGDSYDDFDIDGLIEEVSYYDGRIGKRMWHRDYLFAEYLNEVVQSYDLSV